ncbi:hypothetical protein XELAEV_18028406mg [Xenopus laevis]|uniref:Uncharacterized protein n=1 Tax=Xenopus laevis TaxID=8355 RepID=A0A974CY94_XENLA|nr:hypothetical protein XELAEV_18028406mg [Xenopus laevis]
MYWLFCCSSKLLNTSVRCSFVSSLWYMAILAAHCAILAAHCAILAAHCAILAAHCAILAVQPLSSW